MGLILRLGGVYETRGDSWRQSVPAHFCQSNAIELCASRMGGTTAWSCRHDNGEKALREMDTKGHKEYGWSCFENAWVQRNIEDINQND